MSGPFRSLIAVLLGGAFGGALVGILEVLFVTFVSASSKEYWLFLFGVIGYGGLGIACAVPAALGWLLLRRGKASGGELVQVAVAAALGLPGMVVARYHVIQRVFREELVLMSGAGLITHAVLLAGGLALAVVGVLILRGMTRAGRAALPVALAGLVATALVIGVATDPGEGPPVSRPTTGDASRPNLVLVVVDTLRADAVEPFGGEEGTTPSFARLAREADVFERAYAQSTWTRPSVASILTSQYPSAHGAVHKMDFLPESALTLAEALRDRGYWTAGFTTNINVAPVFNFQQGFDEFRYLEPEFYFGATDSATKLSIYKILRVLRERFFSHRIYYNHYYQDGEVVTRNVSAWLAEEPPEPFFLFVHYMDPHDPFFELPYSGRGVARVMNPNPDASRAEELRGLYLQGVRYLDGHFGDLMDALREHGVYANSTIAVTSDHGEEFQEHGGWWHGTTLYEEAVHVPLLVKRPEGQGGGARRSDLVRTIDVAPTLLASAGLSAPSTFLGKDLYDGPLDEPLLAEEDLEGNHIVSFRRGRWKLILANPGNPRGLAPVELYDLASDPGEKENLEAQEPQRVREMRSQLDDLRRKLPGGSHRSSRLAREDATDPRT